MTNLMKIMIVDDDDTSIKVYQKALGEYQTYCFTESAKALEFALKNEFDLILTDLRMPGLPGLELIKKIREKQDDFTSIIVSAFSDSDVLIDAVNANILHKYLVKPLEPALLRNTVEEALSLLQSRRNIRAEQSQLSQLNQRLQKENSTLKFYAKSPLEALVGFHPSMLKIKEQIKSFALSTHPVLVSGEEGSGKDLVARIIHEMSPRRDHNLVSVNCGAVPEEVLDEQLFGTDAGSHNSDIHPGAISEAAGGSLYLDNVEALSPDLQAKLIRAIQTGEYLPLNATETIKVDIRLICSSRSALINEMNDGKIRKDFYYKVSALHIKLPSLRERREDILPIMEAMASRNKQMIPGLTNKSRDILARYAYPGNVRELEGILAKLNLEMKALKSQDIPQDLLERILQDDAKMYAADQGENAKVTTVHLPTGTENIDMKAFVEIIEREIIDATLRANDYNISQTARSLAISRQGLKNKLKRFEMPFGDDEYDEEEED